MHSPHYDNMITYETTPETRTPSLIKETVLRMPRITIYTTTIHACRGDYKFIVNLPLGQSIVFFFHYRDVSCGTFAKIVLGVTGESNFDGSKFVLCRGHLYCAPHSIV